MLAPASNSSALRTIGSVLVVGGGVPGVQAALDLTELGLKVYLVEKSGAIGGVVGRLDKTLPTNHCSLCILAPKLVEAGRDPNITILTKSKLIALSGEPGRFTAKIRKQPRYIDEEVCTGCAATMWAYPVIGYSALYLDLTGKRFRFLAAVAPDKELFQQEVPFGYLS